jgi:hypothetical protein
MPRATHPYIWHAEQPRYLTALDNARSMIEFMRGTQTPLLTIRSPASVSTASKAAVNLESRSRIMNLALLPASSRSITRLRPSCTTH